jgi:hypothetical protein
LPKDFLLLKLFRWSLKDKALNLLQSLPRNTIASWKYCIKEFMNRLIFFIRPCRLRERSQTCAKTFSRLLMSVPNHVCMDHFIVQYFYGGFNEESKQMVDACPGGT